MSLTLGTTSASHGREPSKPPKVKPMSRKSRAYKIEKLKEELKMLRRLHRPVADKQAELERLVALQLRTEGRGAKAVSIPKPSIFTRLWNALRAA